MSGEPQVAAPVVQLVAVYVVDLYSLGRSSQNELMHSLSDHLSVFPVTARGVAFTAEVP